MKYNGMQDTYLDNMQMVIQYLQAMVTIVTEKRSPEPTPEVIATAEAQLHEICQALMRVGGHIEFGNGRMLDATCAIKLNVNMSALIRVGLLEE